VHSLSGSALEAAAGGQGVTLAQQSFASVDLALGRLVRLSEAVIPMPEPYHICWAPMLLENEIARSFLNWILAEARAD
jgi:LysR family glycine cleavage system transcriptional activator